MSKSTKKVLLGTATLAALSVASGAPAVAATTGVAITAEIVGAIAITSPTAMNFGKMSETGAGTVVLDNANARTPSAAISLVGGGATSAVLNVTAAKATKFDLNVAADTATLAHAGAPTVTDTMKVTSFTIDAAAVGVATKIVRSHTAGTTGTFKMGGTLNITAGEAVGVYSGTITVNATYQ